MEAILKLVSLKQGWSTKGEGVSFDLNGLKWLSDKVDKYFFNINTYAYPAVNGNVNLEWSIGDCEISLDVNIKSHFCEFHLLNLKTNDVKIKKYCLKLDSSWPEIKKNIRIEKQKILNQA